MGWWIALAVWLAPAVFLGIALTVIAIREKWWKK